MSPFYTLARTKCTGTGFTKQTSSQIERYLADGLDVFAYFNNDACGYAVQNAAALRRYVSGN
jgi:uncharacterized protein YecE (DUF72 family)